MAHETPCSQSDATGGNARTSNDLTRDYEPTDVEPERRLNTPAHSSSQQPQNLSRDF